MTSITLLPGSKQETSKSYRVPGGQQGEEKVGVPLWVVLAGLVEQPHSRLASALWQGWLVGEQKTHLRYQTGTPEEGERRPGEFQIPWAQELTTRGENGH